MTFVQLDMSHGFENERLIKRTSFLNGFELHVKLEFFRSSDFGA